MKRVKYLVSLVSVACIIFSSCIFSANAVDLIYGDFTYAVNSGYISVTIKGYLGSEANVVIPNMINNKSVVRIDDYTFASMSTIDTVEISENVRYINSNAFKKSSIKSITIPSTVTDVGSYLFAECTQLTNVNYYSSIIPQSAFIDCTALSSVKLSENLTAIGNLAFARCTSLKEIYIPSGVTSIGDNAFANCSPDLVVKTDSDYVKSYCQANGIPVAVNYGDADGDGYVNIKDATFIQKSVVKFDGYEITSGTAQFTKADVDGNGRVNIRDATLIAKFVVHKITKFPIEENT